MKTTKRTTVQTTVAIELNDEERKELHAAINGLLGLVTNWTYKLRINDAVTQDQYDLMTKLGKELF